MILDKHMEKTLDGKKCIQTLKKANYQWRQMEWIGWFIEYKIKELLFEYLGESDGPSMVIHNLII